MWFRYMSTTTGHLRSIKQSWMNRALKEHVMNGIVIISQTGILERASHSARLLISGRYSGMEQGGWSEVTVTVGGRELGVATMPMHLLTLIYEQSLTMQAISRFETTKLQHKAVWHHMYIVTVGNVLLDIYAGYSHVGQHNSLRSFWLSHSCAAIKFVWACLS